VYIVTVAGYSYAWAQATPFMIRPLWSFGGDTPDTEAVQPVQSNVTWFAILAGLAAVVRCTLMALAAAQPVRPAAVSTGRVGATRWNMVAALIFVPIQTLFVTLLLGGLLSSATLGVVVWILITSIMLARILLVPLIPIYPDLIRKVPLLLRVAICAAVGYVLTNAVVQPYVDQGESSFTPLVTVIFVSLVVAALLLPGPPWRQATPITSPGTPASPPTAPPPSGPGGLMRFIGSAPRFVTALGGITAVIAILAADAQPAYADNCSGLTDCSFGVKVALVVAAIAIVAIGVIVLPELLAAGAAGAAEAAAAEAAAAEAAAAEAAAAEAATAEGAAAQEAAAEAAGESASSEAAATEGQGASTAEGESAAGESQSSVETQFGDKINEQMPERGWTQEQVEQTIENPDRTVETTDTRWNPDGTRNNDPATAYINEDGSYVVRNNETGDIVQISDRTDPGWRSPF
jgi:hypothetical protein